VATPLGAGALVRESSQSTTFKPSKAQQDNPSCVLVSLTNKPMQGPSNVQQQINELKLKFNETQDELFKKLLEEKIKLLYRQLSHESSMILLEREKQSRAARNTHTAPIKCGLRNATGSQVPDKDSHWYWDTASEKDARKLEQVKGKIQKVLFFTPEKALVRKFVILGGLSKTLASLGLSGITALPEQTRREKAQVILALIEQKLNGKAEKLPFC